MQKMRLCRSIDNQERYRRKMKKEALKFNKGAIITDVGSTAKNKTGSWRSMRPKVDEKKCTRCGICWQFCPDIAIRITKEKGAVMNFDYCKGCGICAKECPFKAITMEPEKR